MLQQWSPFTGKLVWTRPVVIEKSYNIYSLLPSLGLMLDGSTVGWKKEKDDRIMESIFVCMVFSPKEQLFVVSAVGLLVLDPKTGNTPRTFLHYYLFFNI